MRDFQNKSDNFTISRLQNIQLSANSTQECWTNIGFLLITFIPLAYVPFLILYVCVVIENWYKNYSKKLITNSCTAVFDDPPSYNQCTKPPNYNEVYS